MADDDDLEYPETTVGSAQSQGVRKNIAIKLKGKGRGKARRGGKGGKKGALPKKPIVGIPEEDEDTIITSDALTKDDSTSEKKVSDTTSLDEVISKLEAPSFSPLDRTFPEPLHQNKKLRWNHKVNLIGEKIMDPMMHCCEKCKLPILNYGRMLPCKHVFCFDCAKKSLNEKNEIFCFKCEDKVQKIEQTAVGTVFMCTYGGARHGPIHCGRTYLSQRDLQAHINYRHLRPAGTTPQPALIHTVHPIPLEVSHVSRDPRDPRGHGIHDNSHHGQPTVASHPQHSHPSSDHRDQDHSRSLATPSPSMTAGQSRQYSHNASTYPSTIPVSSARPNLITVPIQDDSSSAIPTQHSHSQSHTPQYTAPGNVSSHPVPSIQHQPTSYPPPHGYQHSVPPAPNYSQPPSPLTTPTFTQHPPPVHHPPPMHGANRPPMYSNPPPPVHHTPPPNFSAPQGAPPPAHTVPPCFPSPANYEDTGYMQPWAAGGVPPPPTRGQMPPRPLPVPIPAAHNMGHIPTRGPSDPNFRPPYYQ